MLVIALQTLGSFLSPNPEVGSAKNGQARLSSRAAVSGEAIQISGLLRYARNDEPQLFPIFNK